MTLAAVGSGSSLSLDAFRGQCRANAEQYEASAPRSRQGDARGAEPDSVPAEDPRGDADFYAALARDDARGSADTMRSFRAPSLDVHLDGCDPARDDAGADPVRDEDDNRIGPSLFLKQYLPAAGFRSFRSQATCRIWRSRAVQ